MILIVAGNELQARAYAKSVGLGRHEYRSINYPEQAYGFRNPEVRWVGTYDKRRDIDQLREILLAAAMPDQPNHVYPK